MVKAFAEALMGAEADAICGAPYGSPARTGELSQRLPGPAVGYPGGLRGCCFFAGVLAVPEVRVRVAAAVSFTGHPAARRQPYPHFLHLVGCHAVPEADGSTYRIVSSPTGYHAHYQAC